MSEESSGNGRKPSHVAYQVSQGKEGQAYFNRIGAGFPHRDGQGVDIVLDSTPVNGRITLRTAQERLETMKDGKRERSPEKEQDRGA